MAQALRLQSGKTIEVTEREWELLRDMMARLTRFAEVYNRLPDDTKRALHELAEGTTDG